MFVLGSNRPATSTPASLIKKLTTLTFVFPVILDNPLATCAKRSFLVVIPNALKASFNLPCFNKLFIIGCGALSRASTSEDGNNKSFTSDKESVDVSSS